MIADVPRDYTLITQSEGYSQIGGRSSGYFFCRSCHRQCAVRNPPSRKIGSTITEIRKSALAECERSNNARAIRIRIPLTKLPSIPRLTNRPLPAAFVSCQYCCSMCEVLDIEQRLSLTSPIVQS